MNDSATEIAANYMKMCRVDLDTIKKYFPNFDPANDPNIRYNGKTLAESKPFIKHMWAASVALRPDEYYTITEGQILTTAFLNRKVG